MDARRVVVGCAADAAYALPLAVMLRSAASALDPRCTLDVYVVDAGVAPDDRARIAGSLGGCGTVTWVSPERAAFAGLPLWGRMPIATYDKLAIARWMPAGEPRAIWLDADLLVLGDLAALWRSDLRSAVLAATQDPRVPTIGSRFGVRAHASCGLAPRAKYFNAGVMVIDLERWRASDVEGDALAYLRRHREQVYFWDQEALNVAAATRWSELSPLWNWTVSGAAAAVRAAPGEPRILHFSGNLKPWRYAGRGAAHQLYYRHLDETAWSGWRPPPSWWARGLGQYEASPLRRLALPLERCALALLRASTLRYASRADLESAPAMPSSSAS